MSAAIRFAGCVAACAFAIALFYVFTVLLFSL
jgi:hypothetical protein